MSHTCEEATRQLYEYLDEELDGDAAEDIRSHLDACPGCVGSFDFERRLKETVKRCLAEDMPESLHEKVVALIREEQTRAKG